MRESGGQIGDSGYLTSQGIQFNVKDTQKYGQVFGHIGELEQGTLKVGQTVNAVVDAARRHQTSLNHSATHLLHRIASSFRSPCSAKRIVSI